MKNIKVKILRHQVQCHVWLQQCGDTVPVSPCLHPCLLRAVSAHFINALLSSVLPRGLPALLGALGII